MKWTLSAALTLLTLAFVFAGCPEKGATPNPETQKAAPQVAKDALSAADHGKHQAHHAPGADKADDSVRQSPPGAAVYFANLKDGDTVQNPVNVCIRAKKLKVEPAGEVRAGHGHHHILVDVPLSDLDKPIPGDDQHIHMGDGSSCKELTLSPGPHTLRLLFADGAHRPYKPPITAELKITVAPDSPSPTETKKADPKPPMPPNAPIAPTPGGKKP